MCAGENECVRAIKAGKALWRALRLKLLRIDLKRHFRLHAQLKGRSTIFKFLHSVCFVGLFWVPFKMGYEVMKHALLHNALLNAVDIENPFRNSTPSVEFP